MDTAVALAQVSQRERLLHSGRGSDHEAYRHDHARAVTDLEVREFRFRGAGHNGIRGRQHGPLSGRAFEPDPVLGCPAERRPVPARLRQRTLGSPPARAIKDLTLGLQALREKMVRGPSVCRQQCLISGSLRS